MNWDQIEGDWKQFKGKVQEKWGKLTDDELDIIGGKRDRLAGKIEEKYGVAKEEVEKQLHEFLNTKQGEVMYKKIFTVLIFALGIVFNTPLSYGEQKTTTVEETSTQTTLTPASAKSKKAAPGTTTTTLNTKYTTTKEGEPRIVLDQEALKKMSATLCIDGFKSYVSNDKKNICGGQVSAPDIAYSCVWNKKGEAAFAATSRGPCNLDFTQHVGSIVVTKTDYISRPPLPYGSEAHCCVREAKDSSASN